MTVASQVFAVLAGVLHVVFFVFESLLFRRPQIWRRFGVRDQHDADAIAPMALNQGWYNFFLAAGAIGGVLTWAAGPETVGRSIALFSCGCMAAAALVLVVSNPKLARAAILQGVAPLVALLFAVL